MGEDFTQNFKEIFHCQVKGADIADARFNAWTALDKARGIIPRELWKLSQMSHDFQIGEDEDKNPVVFIVCEAIWAYDPDGDSDGGKHADLLGSDTLDPDGIGEETEKEVEETRITN